MYVAGEISGLMNTAKKRAIQINSSILSDIRTYYDSETAIDKLDEYIKKYTEFNDALNNEELEITKKREEEKKIVPVEIQKKNANKEIIQKSKEDLNNIVIILEDGIKQAEKDLGEKKKKGEDTSDIRGKID